MVRECQPASEGMNVSRIAPAAAAQKLNAFRLRIFSKLLKRISWKLDGLQFVWKLRETRETGGCVGGPKRCRLRGNRNADYLAHLASDRQNALRLLFTVDAHDGRARIHHGARAICRRVSV